MSTSIQIKERAENLHLEVLKLKDTLVEGRKQLIQIVLPIYRESLYKYIGFKSWQDYIETTLAVPVSTINNVVLPTTYLLDAGYSPDEFDGINWSRVTDIAKLVKHSGRLPDQEMNELVEVAKKNKTRADAKSFKDKVASISETNGIDQEVFIRIPCEQSFLELFELALKLQQDIQWKATGKSNCTKQSLLEGILVTYFNDADVRFLLRKLPDEEIKPLFNLVQDKEPNEQVVF